MSEVVIFPVLRTPLRRRIERECLRVAGFTHTASRGKLLDQIEAELSRSGASPDAVAAEMMAVTDLVDDRLAFYAATSGLPPAAGLRR